MSFLLNRVLASSSVRILSTVNQNAFGAKLVPSVPLSSLGMITAAYASKAAATTAASAAAPSTPKKAASPKTAKSTKSASATAAAATPKKKASTAASKPAKAASDLLADKTPSRSTVLKLKKGTITKPKLHWVPIPSPPSSPYIMFFKEVSKEIADKWKNLSESEKKRYQGLADQDKKRFEKEASEFFAKRSPDQFYLQKLPQHLLGIDPLKSPKSPPGSYALFVKEISSQNPSLKLLELSKLAASKWNGMSTAERKPWHDKAEALKADYSKALESFMKKLPPGPPLEAN